MQRLLTWNSFLWGDLEEKSFIDFPKGLKDGKSTDVLVLNKSIYGLVQAAQQYHKIVVQILGKIGLEGGDVDPWLHKSKTCIEFVVSYVDDNLLNGNYAAIDEVIKLLQKEGFILKIKDNLKDCLSCNIHFSKLGKEAWLGQPHLFANLNQKFGKSVENLQMYNTTGSPGHGEKKLQVKSRRIDWKTTHYVGQSLECYYT